MPDRRFSRAQRVGLVWLFSLVLCAPALVLSQTTADRPEPGTTEAIAAATTAPQFLSSWVATVPESATVPSPSDYLGHIAGAEGELPNSGTIYGYMRALAAASERVHLEVIGETEEGREILLLAIADEDGITKLPELKAATAALADPRETDPDEAVAIIAEARPIYYFNGAIHADESGAPDMLMELAYRLAVSETPMIQRIRRELVVLINPVANPDGRDKMSDWFYRHIAGWTGSFDALPRQSPPYWGSYVMVDANRDAHQLVLSTTQAVARMFFDWHPTVILDLHEAIALLQTWNGTGPYNPNVDPISYTEMLEMSFHEMSAMNAHGMPGVWTWDFGEGFGHHYTDSVAMNHNSLGRGYETFGNAVPLTVDRKLNPYVLEREWFRPWPPARNVTWSHRDDVNYSQTAALATLDQSAGMADQMLHNFYAKGRNSWLKGVAGDPFAFVIPADQPDVRRVQALVDRLLTQRIEVARATADFEVAEGTFAAGDYVVRLDQPYRNYAVDLLLPQEFPDDAEHEPYDDTSWALPVHYGVETVRVDDGAIRDVPLREYVGAPWPEGGVRAAGAAPPDGANGAPATAPAGVEIAGYVLADHGQEVLLAARYRLGDHRVEVASEAFSVGDRHYPAGSWIVPSGEGVAEALRTTAVETSLFFQAVSELPDVARHAAPLPRLGVWVPWADTDMSGWIRLTLDTQGIPYTYLRDEEIRAGNLHELVDVIVYGTVLMDLDGQIHGIEPVTGPLAFNTTPEFPSLGVPVASDDITGGIGWNGLANLEAFVREGGLLITLGNGSTLVLDSGFVRSVARADLPDVTSPGSHLRTRFLQPQHPIAYGYPRVGTAFRSPYAIYDPPRRWLTMAYCTSCLNGPIDLRHVVLQWGTRPFGHEELGDDAPSAEEAALPIIVSGGGTNTEQLQGRPAILDVPLGEGQVIAYNFNPMHRDLNRADYRYLWNAIVNWRAILDRPDPE